MGEDPAPCLRVVPSPICLVCFVSKVGRMSAGVSYRLVAIPPLRLVSGGESGLDRSPVSRDEKGGARWTATFCLNVLSKKNFGPAIYKVFTKRFASCFGAAPSFPFLTCCAMRTQSPNTPASIRVNEAPAAESGDKPAVWVARVCPSPLTLVLFFVLFPCPQPGPPTPPATVIYLHPAISSSDINTTFFKGTPPAKHP